MIRYTMTGVVLLLALSARALPTAERVAGSPAAVELLAHECIVVTATGLVAVAYPGMARAFASTNLLGDLQREYAREQPPGRSPEFEIKQRAPGEYHYVNKDNQESSILEIYRAEHDGPVTELVLLASGRRFFGRFQSLIHVAVTPATDRSLRYEVVVHAYPECGVSRFLARHLGLVERYFHSKTAEIEKLSARIGGVLAAPPAAETAELALAHGP